MLQTLLQSPKQNMSLLCAFIVSSYGRFFIVETKQDQQRFIATIKDKKNSYVVGDIVLVRIINKEQAQIISLETRRNLVSRAYGTRCKLIASNIDNLLIVIASKPTFNSYLLNSALIVAAKEQITPIIVINKEDLQESKSFISYISNLYAKQLGISVISIQALDSANKLTPFIAKKISLLIGQSGVGKSTIINQLVHSANAKTGTISKNEQSGRHTTTNATLYWLRDIQDQCSNNHHKDQQDNIAHQRGSPKNQKGAIIDCPGLEDFGLTHIGANQLAQYMPECLAFIGKCRFRNCKHLNEPECAIITAHTNGFITKERLEFLQGVTKRLLSNA